MFMKNCEKHADYLALVDIKDNKLRKTFQDEFRAFPNGEHDDIVDAAAHVFNYINQEFIGNDIFEIVEI